MNTSKFVNGIFTLQNNIKQLINFEAFYNQFLILMQKEKSFDTPFIRKMKEILQNPDFEKIIAWDLSGTMVQIFQIQDLETRVLKKYFRHNKFPSFIRQLNLYGFRKVKKDGPHSFLHPKFSKKQLYGQQNIVKLEKEQNNLQCSSQQSASQQKVPQNFNLQPNYTSNERQVYPSNIYDNCQLELNWQFSNYQYALQNFVQPWNFQQCVYYF